jgi:hypothetical protein
MTRVFFKDVKVNCIANTCATDHKVKTGLAIHAILQDWLYFVSVTIKDILWVGLYIWRLRENN